MRSPTRSLPASASQGSRTPGGVRRRTRDGPDGPGPWRPRGVGALAAQLARWGGATVLGTVRRSADLGGVKSSLVRYAVALDQPDPATAIRAHASEGVDRIIEVAVSDNVDLPGHGLDGDAILCYKTSSIVSLVPLEGSCRQDSRPRRWAAPAYRST